LPGQRLFARPAVPSGTTVQSVIGAFRLSSRHRILTKHKIPKQSSSRKFVLLRGCG
jgi:hypothetical protein